MVLGQAVGNRATMLGIVLLAESVYRIVAARCPSNTAGTGHVRASCGFGFPWGVHCDCSPFFSPQSPASRCSAAAAVPHVPSTMPRSPPDSHSAGWPVLFLLHTSDHLTRRTGGREHRPPPVVSGGTTGVPGVPLLPAAAPGRCTGDPHAISSGREPSFSVRETRNGPASKTRSSQMQWCRKSADTTGMPRREACRWRNEDPAARGSKPGSPPCR